MRRFLFGCAVFCAVGVSGCADSIARRVVRAPNAAWADRLPLQTTIPLMLDATASEVVRVRRIPVASGAVSLRAVIVEPSDVPWQPVTIRNEPQWTPAWSLNHRQAVQRHVPLATVLILHGLNGSSEWTAAHAAAAHAACLANAGFRCVLIDLRGHGESTGDTVSFGKFEAADIREALTRLHADGTISGPLILMGCSLGGSVALMAASEPTPVAAVIAIAPFAQVADVAPHFAHRFAGWLTWLVTDGLTRNTIAAMGRLGGFDPVSDSPLAWAPRVQVPVLLIHGADDDLVPPEQSTQLAKALGGEVTRVVIQGQEHIATVLEPGLTMPTILPWLEQRFVRASFRAVVGPLAGWPGDGASASQPLSATWAWRATPADRTATWPRPPGERNVRTWARLPLAWLGHDLTYDLGSIDGADETWCGPLRLGGYPAIPDSFPPLFRRYTIPGWLTTPTVELTIHITTTKDGGGIRWATGGTALLRLSSQLPSDRSPGRAAGRAAYRSSNREDERESQP